MPMVYEYSGIEQTLIPRLINFTEQDCSQLEKIHFSRNDKRKKLSTTATLTILSDNAVLKIYSEGLQ